jgi:hypothetical protein
VVNCKGPLGLPCAVTGNGHSANRRAFKPKPDRGETTTHSRKGCEFFASAAEHCAAGLPRGPSTAKRANEYMIAPIVSTRFREPNSQAEGAPNMITILVVILLLVALGALPAWPHSRGWGYYPSGGLGLVVLVLVILLLLGRI